MPLRKLETILSSNLDSLTLNHFIAIWRPIENILESFTRAKSIPIFVYLDQTLIYQSAVANMPPFCRLMLTNDRTRVMCEASGRQRADRTEPDVAKRTQLCHAGMLNGRREIFSEIGKITILFGSKKTTLTEGVERKREFLAELSKSDKDLSKRLSEADAADRSEEFGGGTGFADADLSLITSIAALIEQYIKSTVGFRVLTMNMAHELTFTLIELGQLATLILEMLSEISVNDVTELQLSELQQANTTIAAESRLGLYLVRNIFSYSSESKYSEVVRPSFSWVNLSELLKEMIELHRWRAKEKRIEIVAANLDNVPVVWGSDLEIRRVLHNILNNAIKYSYHTTNVARRAIKISYVEAYDPGFQSKRFAIEFENYGLGLTDAEKLLALKPGFRGSQAVEEVPMGAGIGLSEVEKIMRLHRGQVKIESKETHENPDGTKTYLTTVKLIFRREKNA